MGEEPGTRLVWSYPGAIVGGDMSVDQKVYTDTSKKARTLQKMKELSAQSYSTRLVPVTSVVWTIAKRSIVVWRAAV